MRPLVLVVLALALGSLEAAQLGPSIQILSDQPLPPAVSKAADLRWAGSGSVYLALLRSGTVEASLEPLGGKIREIIPAESKPGGYWGSLRLGASSKFLVAGAPFGNLTWLPIGSSTRQEFDIDVLDLDVFEDKLLVLGARRDSEGNWAPEGAIAWLGSLDKKLADLRPILFDAKGPGAPNLNACRTFELGAVRFLQDGSFFIFPGVQPGAFLYDPSGKLIRTWDSIALGIDLDCTDISPERSRQLQPPIPRVAWLNQYRTVDDVLPLRQGPALLVKSVVRGVSRWELKVLGRKGEVATVQLPISYTGFRGTLRGDAKDDRLALLQVDHKEDGMRSSARLILAKLSTTTPPAKAKGED